MNIGTYLNQKDAIRALKILGLYIGDKNVGICNNGDYLSNLLSFSAMRGYDIHKCIVIINNNWNKKIQTIKKELNILKEKR